MSILTIILSVLLLVAIVFVFYEFYKKRPKRRLVGYVSGLRTHPVKSTKPVILSKAEITQLGVMHDRQFVLLNKHGTFMTLRKHPKFVLITTTITDDFIVLEGDGMELLKLPLSMKKDDGDNYKDITVFRKTGSGVHVSSEADDWFSTYLGVEGCTLYCYPTDGVPRYADNRGVKVDNYTNERDSLMFADGCPLLLVSEGSAESIDKRMDEDVMIDRFRANVIITGCAPFAEESWGLIEINNVQLQSLYPCGRCVAINVDPKNADVNENILPELTKVKPSSDGGYPLIKSAALFGMNYGVRKVGFINIGDAIYDISG